MKDLLQEVKSVGEVLVARTKALIEILAGEPKHQALDVAFREVKEAVEKITGTPERHSGRYTEEGHTLIVPAQEGLYLDDDWSDDKPELEVVRPEGWKAPEETADPVPTTELVPKGDKPPVPPVPVIDPNVS